MKNPNAFPIGKKFGFFICGGDDETRTHYLYNANVALSQMSYAPETIIILPLISGVVKMYLKSRPKKSRGCPFGQPRRNLNFIN